MGLEPTTCTVRLGVDDQSSGSKGLQLTLSNIILPDDIVLTLGAGSIGKIASGLCGQVTSEMARP